MNINQYLNVIKYKIYDELHQKFNYTLNVSGENKVDILEEIRSLKNKTQDLYFNYLLSLSESDEDFKMFVWNIIAYYDLNKVKFTGKLNELFHESQDAWRNYLEHENYNKTKPISNDIITLEPLLEEDKEYFLKEIEKDRDNDNFYYGIKFSNGSSKEAWFEIINKDNIKVGVVGINSDDMSICSSTKKYNLFYYVFPEHRNKTYAYNGAKLLLEALKEKKIIVEKEDPFYKYLLKPTPIDCKIVNMYIRDWKEYSLKIAKHLGIKEVGKYNSYYNGDFETWHMFQEIIDPVSDKQIIDKEFNEAFENN